MAAGNDFLRFSLDLVPTALKGFFGRRLHGTFALIFNELADGARQSVRLKFPNSDTPTDALPFLARNFSVPWFGTESETSYRSALRASDDTVGAPGVIVNGADSEEPASGLWRRAVERGSVKSVEEALARAGINGIVEESRTVSGGYDPVFPFFRYRIRLPDFIFADCEPYLYGQAPPYGGGWHYGVKLPFATVKTILDVHRFYAPARSKLEDIVCGPVLPEDFVWTKFTISQSQLASAGTTNDIELFVLPANGVFHGYVIAHTQAFGGGAITDYFISLGTTADAQRYAPGFDVFQAVGPTVRQVPAALACLAEGVATSVRIAALSVGAPLNAATTGVVDIHILTTDLVP